MFFRNKNYKKKILIKKNTCANRFYGKNINFKILGVVSDFHEYNVAPARSRALNQADVVFLIGARLNWILHFGQPPRFAKNVKII